MATIIQGYVFDDVLSNGTYEPTDPGIPNAYVVLLGPDGVCTNVQTNAAGIYTFPGLTLPGEYTIYETVEVPLACPPDNFSQPAGFTNSTTVRSETLTITQSDIDNNVTLSGKDFGHDNANAFTCAPVGYVVVVPTDVGGNSQFYSLNIATGDVEFINTDMGLVLNSIGYSTVDNLIYGLQTGTTNLIRIDADGNIVNLGPIPNLPPITYFIGSADTDGHLYITSTDDFYYTVDIDPNSPTYGQLLDPLNNFAPDTPPYGTPYDRIGGGDWSYNVADGLLYAVNPSDYQVSTLDPLTGVVTEIPTTGLNTGGGFGTLFMDADGILYGVQNSTGDVYRFVFEDGMATAELFSFSIPTSSTDGTICPNAQIHIDYGDAPDIGLGNGYGNYSTLLASDGPRHQIINELYLGSQVTGEMDAYQNTVATGDDLLEGIPDDGVEMPLPPLYQCVDEYSFTVNFTNNTGEPANLYAWVDFNGDGIFQSNEASAVQVVQPGAGLQQTVLNFTVPEGVTPPTYYTFARIRLTTDELIDNNTSPGEADTRSLGPASDGEVEDYYIEVKCCTYPWKQSTFKNLIELPCGLPCIGRITSTHESVSVSSFYVIKTPVTSFNPEGEISTGYKAVVKGILSCNIEYTDCSCNGQMHSLHQDIPFCSAIGLDCYSPGDCLYISAYIEDISYVKISECVIQINSLIAVGAEISRPSVPKP